MSPFSRREFLDRSALLAAVAAAGATARPAAAAAKKGAANDRLRVAVVGVRGRGMEHVRAFGAAKNCEVVAVCDADEAVIAPAMKKVTEARGEAPKYVKDFRHLLDDKSIDIISIATPNHWHALMAVWALKAGKDVYVEKPASHNVHEGRILAGAAAKAGRVVQVGTQSRSNPGIRAAISYIHSGKIGPVDLAYGTCYKSRKSIGKVSGPTAPPATLDYDLWCGPARVLPVMRKQLHYDWHWTWEYGNGDFGNQGVHEVDKARWGLNRPGLPRSVTAVGGRFGYRDDGETPNTELALFDYGPSKLLFEVRGLDTADYQGARVGNIWFGTDGYVVYRTGAGGAAFTRDGKKVADFPNGADQHHFDNFVAAVRDHNPAGVNCPPEEGHLSAALCHLANISYRLGAEAALSGAVPGFAATPAATEALARMRQHLRDNKVDVATAVGRVGPTLKFDPATERFTSAGGADLSRANELLFDEYRKGFEIGAG